MHLCILISALCVHFCLAVRWVEGGLELWKSVENVIKTLIYLYFFTSLESFLSKCQILPIFKVYTNIPVDPFDHAVLNNLWHRTGYIEVCTYCLHPTADENESVY